MRLVFLSTRSNTNLGAIQFELHMCAVGLCVSHSRRLLVTGETKEGVADGRLPFSHFSSRAWAGAGDLKRFPDLDISVKWDFSALCSSGGSCVKFDKLNLQCGTCVSPSSSGSHQTTTVDGCLWWMPQVSFLHLATNCKTKLFFKCTSWRLFLTTFPFPWPRWRTSWGRGKMRRRSPKDLRKDNGSARWIRLHFYEVITHVVKIKEAFPDR